MKTTMKLFLIVAILSANAFADGNMNNGGRTCTPTPTTPCLFEGETDKTKTDDGEENSETSILKAMKDYLISIFG